MTTQQSPVLNAFRSGATYFQAHERANNTHQSLKVVLDQWSEAMKAQARLSGLKLDFQSEIKNAAKAEDVAVEITATKNRFWRNKSLRITIRDVSHRQMTSSAFHIRALNDRGEQVGNPMAGLTVGKKTDEHLMDSLKEVLSSFIYEHLLDKDEIVQVAAARNSLTIS